MKNSLDIKQWWKSKTIVPLIITVATFVMPKLFGIKVPKETVESIVAMLGTIQPDALAVLTAAAATWARLVKVDFSKSKLTSKTVWFTTLTAILSIAHAWGVDTSAVNDFTQVLAVYAQKYAVPLAGILSLFGAITAKKAIVLP